MTDSKTARGGGGPQKAAKELKAHQASLAEESAARPDNIDRLVSQAFDNDPKIRLRIAEELSRIDDPRSLFALVELSSDKDGQIREFAKEAMGNFKVEEEAVISLEKLFAKRKEVKKPEEIPQVRQKMLPTIEKLFAHYPPKKREKVKKMLMPSLEKLFAVPAPGEPDPLSGIDEIDQLLIHKFGEENSPGNQSPQTEIRGERPAQLENAPNFPIRGENPESVELKKETGVEIAEYSGEEGFDFDDSHDDEMPRDKYFQFAYSIATTPGMGKGELKREQNRIVSDFKKKVGIAFKMAEERAKENGLANFSTLKPGMRRLSFTEMPVISVSDVGFGTKREHFAKVYLSDGKKEIAVLIPPERAIGIGPQDCVALKNVATDFLIDSNEVVLVVKKVSKIIVVK